MQALVYQGPNHKNVEERPKPVVQLPTDAIVRLTKTTICGTDLHILKGDVATCLPGTILGHEGVWGWWTAWGRVSPRSNRATEC